MQISAISKLCTADLERVIHAFISSVFINATWYIVVSPNCYGPLPEPICSCKTSNAFSDSLYADHLTLACFSTTSLPFRFVPLAGFNKPVNFTLPSCMRLFENLPPVGILTEQSGHMDSHDSCELPTKHSAFRYKRNSYGSSDRIWHSRKPGKAAKHSEWTAVPLSSSFVHSS